MFSLIPRIRDPKINPGETVEIDIFLTGYGPIPKFNKLYVSNSSPQLFQPDENNKIGYIQTCILSYQDDKGILTGVITGNAVNKNPRTGLDEPAIQKHEVDPTGTTMRLGPSFFDNMNLYFETLGQKPPDTMVNIMGEGTYDGFPPIYTSLNTSRKAPPGDHSVTFSLFYEAEDNVIQMDQKNVEVHVKNWIEINQKKIQKLAVGIGIFALLCELIQTYFTALPFF